MPSICHPPRRSSGFIFVQLLAGLMMVVTLVGVLGYTFVSMSRSSVVAQTRVSTKLLLTQAAYALAGEANDTESDTFWEAPAGVSSALNGDGWDVPAASAAPKLDDRGTKFKYCAWKNKVATAAPAPGVDAATSTAATSGRLIGDIATASDLSIVLAVISAGDDKIFQTTCANAKAASLKGDDDMRTMNGKQIAQNIGGGLTNIGASVADLTELYALPASVIKQGQMRVVRCNDTTAGCTAAQKPSAAYINKSATPGQANWALSSGSGGGITKAANLAAVNALAGVDGDVVIAKDTGAVYYYKTTNTPKWQLITTRAQGSTFASTTPAAGPVAITVLKDTALALRSIFTIGGGGPPYTIGPPVPVAAAPAWPPLNFAVTTATTTNANDTLKVSSTAKVQNAVWGPFSYDVTVTDGFGALPSSPFRFSLQIIDWLASDGYNARFLQKPIIVDAGPASCPAGWLAVPSTYIPSTKGTSTTSLGTYFDSDQNAGTTGVGAPAAGITPVPGFCVMPFAAVDDGTGTAATATTTNAYNTKLPYLASILTGESKCSTVKDANGNAVTGAKLMRETQWEVIAHNLAGMGPNWTAGVVGGLSDTSNHLIQGLRDNTVSSLQPATCTPTCGSASNNRTHKLSTGQTIYDMGGHVAQWVWDDLVIPSTPYMDSSTIPQGVAAGPFASATRGMGNTPDPSAAGGGWGSQYFNRGGSYNQGVATNGIFSTFTVTSDQNLITSPSPTGFRCTLIPP
jgi:hypothetical protein